MAHFNFENAVADAVRLDAPMQRGPLMRWQRKAMEAGVKSLSLSDGNTNASLRGPRSAKTPGSHKTPMTPYNEFITPKTPLSPRGLTPRRTNLNVNTPGEKAKRVPTVRSKSPGGKTPLKSKFPTTPHQCQSDRFIPNRLATDMEAGHYRLVSNAGAEVESQEQGTSDEMSPSRSGYQNKMSEVLGDGQPDDVKILSFKQKAPQAKEGHINTLKVLYSSAQNTGPRAQTTRYIPSQPERILDAPELPDDYYLNLLSWSANNHIALGLGSPVYLWNAGSGAVTELMELENPEEYVSSVSWIKEGNILAVGNSLGSVQLWDVAAQKLVRTMGGHAARVGALAWNSYILSSGSRTGYIHHHDVRVADHHVGTLQGHTQEICGLAWSPNGRHLASGGNDNLINIWDTNLGQVSPLLTFSHHQAAVKALSWCPWQSSLLASGGGTGDRHIRFWNTTSGSALNSVDTNSQVCAILWSTAYKEMISGHGYSKNQLTIWKYPAMTKVTELTGHSARILSLAMSPDGTTVISAAADETLRLWKCFAVDKQQKTVSTKPVKDTNSKKSSVLRGTIR